MCQSRQHHVVTSGSQLAAALADRRQGKATPASSQGIPTYLPTYLEKLVKHSIEVHRIPR